MNRPGTVNGSNWKWRLERPLTLRAGAPARRVDGRCRPRERPPGACVGRRPMIYLRTRLLAMKSTFAGRSASRRIRYRYQSGP